MRIFFEREKLHQEEIKNDLGRCENISIQKALNKMKIEQKENEMLMSIQYDTVNSIDKSVQSLSEQVCEGLVGKLEDDKSFISILLILCNFSILD